MGNELRPGKRFQHSVEAFETAVEEKRTTSPLWGIIIGCAALAALLAAGYAIVA